MFSADGSFDRRDPAIVDAQFHTGNDAGEFRSGAIIHRRRPADAYAGDGATDRTDDRAADAARSSKLDTPIGLRIILRPQQ